MDKQWSTQGLHRLTGYTHMMITLSIYPLNSRHGSKDTKNASRKLNSRRIHGRKTRHSHLKVTKKKGIDCFALTTSNHLIFIFILLDIARVMESQNQTFLSLTNQVAALHEQLQMEQDLFTQHRLQSIALWFSSFLFLPLHISLACPSLYSSFSSLFFMHICFNKELYPPFLRLLLTSTFWFDPFFLSLDMPHNSRSLYWSKYSGRHLRYRFLTIYEAPAYSCYLLHTYIHTHTHIETTSFFFFFACKPATKSYCQ